MKDYTNNKYNKRFWEILRETKEKDINKFPFLKIHQLAILIEKEQEYLRNIRMEDLF